MVPNYWKYLEKDIWKQKIISQNTYNNDFLYIKQ